MSQKSYFTTNGTKYAPRTQAYTFDYELFEAIVFCLGVLSGKSIFTFATTSKLLKR
jgi:hypothetical protein